MFVPTAPLQGRGHYYASSHSGLEWFLSFKFSVYFSGFSVFQTFSVFCAEKGVNLYSFLRNFGSRFSSFQFLPVCFSFFQCAFLVCFQGSPLKIAETLKKTEKH